MKRNNPCPRCESSAVDRVPRKDWERVFKPWRAEWHRMECNICHRLYWIRPTDSLAGIADVVINQPARSPEAGNSP
jgi:hypothetical protein